MAGEIIKPVETPLVEPKFTFSNEGEMSVWISCCLNVVNGGSVSMTDAMQRADKLVRGVRERIPAGLSIVKDMAPRQ